MNPSHETRRCQMVEYLLKLAPDPGYNRTALEDVRLLRSDACLPHTPVLYDPCIVIVCQGRKHAMLGEHIYVYDAQHYLVVSVPLPFVSQTDASPEEPMLAISLRLNLALLTDLLLTLEREIPKTMQVAPATMVSTPLEDELADAVLRLLRALERPLESKALGAALQREIYYRVLNGAQGAALRAALAQQGNFGRISQVVRHIHAHFQQPIDVADLARLANMSLPSFHKYFKSVTHMSPMQYVKSTRLHHARLLMVRSGLSAAAASIHIGYESPSQFNREFKRFFGHPPLQETKRMQAMLRVKAEMAWPNVPSLGV